jgi:hypothetical protein
MTPDLRLSREGQEVFGGSGSTLIAAEQTGRRRTIPGQGDGVHFPVAPLLSNRESRGILGPEQTVPANTSTGSTLLRPWQHRYRWMQKIPEKTLFPERHLQHLRLY